MRNKTEKFGGYNFAVNFVSQSHECQIASNKRLQNATKI